MPKSIKHQRSSALGRCCQAFTSLEPLINHCTPRLLIDHCTPQRPFAPNLIDPQTIRSPPNTANSGPLPPCPLTHRSPSKRSNVPLPTQPAQYTRPRAHGGRSPQRRTPARRARPNPALLPSPARPPIPHKRPPDHPLDIPAPLPRQHDLRRRRRQHRRDGQLRVRDAKRMPLLHQTAPRPPRSLTIRTARLADGPPPQHAPLPAALDAGLRDALGPHPGPAHGAAGVRGQLDQLCGRGARRRRRGGDGGAGAGCRGCHGRVWEGRASEGDREHGGRYGGLRGCASIDRACVEDK